MMSDAPDPTLIPHSGEGAAEKGIDLLALFAAYCLEWRLAVTTFAVVTLLCIGIVFSLKTQYVAQCAILPQAGKTDSDFSSLFSTRSPAALYVGLLQSRSVGDYIVDEAHLLDLFHTKSRDAAVGELFGKTTITAGLDSIVTIKVKDPDAREAALIANAYLDGLEHLNQVMSQEASRQTKDYFQQELNQEKDDLDRAEAQLEQTQKQTGIIQPEAQTQIGLTAIATTRSQINALEVQLAALLQSATEQNPQVKLLRSQLAQLRATEAMQEVGASSTPVGAAPSAGHMPQNNLDFLRAQREVHYHDAIVSALSNQFETARLSEEVTRSNFQVVDRALVPEGKSWPPRRMLLIVGLFVGLLFGLAAVAAKLIFLRLLHNPDNQSSFQAIRRAFGRG